MCVGVCVLVGGRHVQVLKRKFRTFAVVQALVTYPQLLMFDELVQGYVSVRLVTLDLPATLDVQTLATREGHVFRIGGGVSAS